MWCQGARLVEAWGPLRSKGEVPSTRMFVPELAPWSGTRRCCILVAQSSSLLYNFRLFGSDRPEPRYISRRVAESGVERWPQRLILLTPTQKASRGRTFRCQARCCLPTIPEVIISRKGTRLNKPDVFAMQTTLAYIGICEPPSHEPSGDDVE